MRKIYILTTLLFQLLILSLACSNPFIGDDERGIVQPPTPVYPEIEENPIFHPDGQRIVYQHNAITEVQEGGAYDINPDSMGLWISDINGDNPKMLLEGRSIDADFNPDGTWIVYELNAQIYKAPFTGDSIDTSQVIQLTPGGRNFFPDWSPDGEWIAYDRSISDGYGPYGIWVMKNDGSGKKHIYPYSRAPSWHPDCKRLFTIKSVDVTASQSSYIFIVRYPFEDTPPDTLDIVITSNSVRYVKVSPDGQHILFQSSPGGGNVSIYVMNINGSNLNRLSDGYDPSWSPDGNQIVFIRKSPKVMWGLGTIWIMDKDGNNLKQITFVPENISFINR